uniref:Uncharacterized protein n=1 Tax=Meloidogyne enterolobii TaxID=390850 RepID=A0A6V7XP46_MELEN|nr:unnamed protein product [Meloidogyne enterolobii]
MRMPLNIRDNSTNSTIYLNLNPFNDLLKEIQLFPYKRNILFFDIDGAEWDIFGVILNKTFCDKWLRSFKQICLKIRIWGMEESENWRRFYLWLLRIEECEFEKTFIYQINQSTFLIVYTRKQIVGLEFRISKVGGV